MTRQEAINRLERGAPFSELYDEVWENALVMAIEALKDDPQRAYDQGVKDTLDKYDESCRIASYISVAIGCKTGKECWELIHNGEIQKVKHGRWINVKISILGNSSAECSLCGAVVHNNFSNVINYCPNCGAKMDLDEAKE